MPEGVDPRVDGFDPGFGDGGLQRLEGVAGDAEGEAAQRAALAEIALIVPVLPREVAQWTGNACEMDFVLRHRRMVLRNEDWRTGAIVFELIARNERVRALHVRGAYARDLAYGDIR